MHAYEIAKVNTRNALVSLSNLIDEQLGNLDQFYDERSIVALSDLEIAFERMRDASENFAETFEAAKEGCYDPE